VLTLRRPVPDLLFRGSDEERRLLDVSAETPLAGVDAE